jgi:glycerate kinase
MRILIAPNAFKNSLNANEVTSAIARGLERSSLDFPFGIIRDGRTAVIEMADASGMRLLTVNELDPLQASSVGTGELIRAALDSGVREIILCVGGSATVDGGAGLLQALGVRFVDSAGRSLLALPAALVDIEAIDLSELDIRTHDCAFTVLCDVDNPILGEAGAARVFGPQKGATPAAVDRLEAALSRWCEVLRRQTEQDVATLAHGGAAGGVAAGLKAVLKARLVGGIEYFLDVTDFNRALQSSDLVITGEGSIDEQTLQCKAPYGVAMRAKALGVPVVALAGQVPLEPGPTLRQCFDVLLPIGSGPCSVSVAIRRTGENLTRTAWELRNALALGAIPKKE